MVNIRHGEVKNGSIVFSEPLDLPEGAQVSVVVEPLAESGAPIDLAEGQDFNSLPFFGMWADREEMQDSTAWVRQAREQWQQRAARQD